jgi:valyl-tRNA synthetase
MHPFMPLITDFLSHYFTGSKGSLSENMKFEAPKLNFNTENVDWSVKVAQRVRSLRGMMNVSPALKLDVTFMGDDKAHGVLEQNFAWISHLARLASLSRTTSPLSGNQFVSIPIEQSTLFLDLGQGVDVSEVVTILSKKALSLSADCDKLEGKIQNETYKNAKPDLWDEDVENFESKTTELKQLQTILNMIGK